MNIDQKEIELVKAQIKEEITESVILDYLKNNLAISVVDNSERGMISFNLDLKLKDKTLSSTKFTRFI